MVNHSRLQVSPSIYKFPFTNLHGLWNNVKEEFYNKDITGS